jgi:hypothetical protein
MNFCGGNVGDSILKEVAIKRIVKQNPIADPESLHRLCFVVGS